MNLKRNITALILVVFLLVSCKNTPQTTGTGEPKGVTPTIDITPAITYVIVTNTPETVIVLPTLTTAPLATATTEATATSTPTGLPDYSSSTYLDDRSTAGSLILSYTNAINRHEYLRAYSYWPNAGSALGTLSSFTSSMSAVSSETVTMGSVTSEGAAGSSYFTVPAAVTDHLSAGGTNKYAVCYVLRFPNPGNYGTPPIQPLHFDQFTRTLVDAGISDSNVIAAACNNVEGLPSAAATVEDQGDLSSANYIDNRSGPLEVVKSLLNAINHKEYVRAYSYWENPAPVIGSYTTYAAGFNDTSSVTASFGTIASDAGAGQFYYKVPVAENVVHTDNSKHIYVGCYTLHLSSPGAQGALPFKALSITKGYFKEYSIGTDVAPLLTTVCK
jgi:hypothetical protein